MTSSPFGFLNGRKTAPYKSWNELEFETYTLGGNHKVITELDTLANKIANSEKAPGLKDIKNLEKLEEKVNAERV